MLFFLFFVICFLASLIGAICGIGGGVIIKPSLDAFHVLDVSAISFLSGCTVLSMTAYSVARARLGGDSHIERKTGIPLALGAAFGGVAGKWLFSFLSALSGSQNKVGAIQSACLLAVTAGTLLYTLCKSRIRTHRVTNRPVCALIGLLLGLLSSFLGIGGGPVNLIVLFFFFSMDTKEAAENSLYIIFYSQAASLLSSLLSRNIPDFRLPVLILMAAGGIAGGICGRALNRKLSVKTVDRLFMGLMLVIIFINFYNFRVFTGSL